MVGGVQIALRQFQGDSVVRWHPGRVIFQQRAVFIKQDA